MLAQNTTSMSASHGVEQKEGIDAYGENTFIKLMVGITRLVN